MRRIYNSMNSLAIARAGLGLTQEQMAVQLGISRSMVKMVETNKRFLTSDTLMKLAAMQIQLAGVLPQAKTAMPAGVNELYDKISNCHSRHSYYHETHCCIRAKQLERKLEIMQQEHEQLLDSLHQLDALATDDTGASDHTKAYLLMRRPRLLKKLSACSPLEQAKTRNKIALLYTEATLNKRIRPCYVHTNENPIFSPLKQSNMEYSVSMISSRADCQVMIDMANKDLGTLTYRLTGLQRQKESASTNSVGIEADLAAEVAEISALQTVIANLPEGPTKEENKVKLTKAEYRKFLLDQRKTSYGALSQIGKEYDIACAQKSVEETNAYIGKLTARMNELPG